MKRKIVYENEVAFMPGAKAVATSYKKTEDAAAEKVVIPKDFSSWPWSPWGDDNLFPQNVLKDLEKNSIALRALENARLSIMAVVSLLIVIKGKITWALRSGNRSLIRRWSSSSESTG